MNKKKQQATLGYCQLKGGGLICSGGWTFDLLLTIAQLKRENFSKNNLLVKISKILIKYYDFAPKNI